MTDLIFEFVATPANPVPSSPGSTAEPPGAPCELPNVDPSCLSPWRWIEVVNDLGAIDLRLIDHVSMEQPITPCQLAHAMHVTLPLLDDLISRCERGESYRRLKRWTDWSRYGAGRTFVGTCGEVGLPEPDGPVTEGGALPEVDPRTVLAIIRCGVGESPGIALPKLAERLHVPLYVAEPVVAQLFYAGHIDTRRRGATTWAYPVVWEHQIPKRRKAKAKAVRSSM